MILSSSFVLTALAIILFQSVFGAAVLAACLAFQSLTIAVAASSVNCSVFTPSLILSKNSSWLVILSYQVSPSVEVVTFSPSVGFSESSNPVKSVISKPSFANSSSSVNFCLASATSAVSLASILFLVYLEYQSCKDLSSLIFNNSLYLSFCSSNKDSLAIICLFKSCSAIVRGSTLNSIPASVNLSSSAFLIASNSFNLVCWALILKGILNASGITFIGLKASNLVITSFCFSTKSLILL